jgi:dCTP deaminase
MWVAYERDDAMISPFSERGIIDGKSFGLSGCSYDVRIAETMWLFPGWGRKASTIERFQIPNDIAGRIYNKSSWSRVFVRQDNNLLDPGWRGYLTLELTRHLPWPVLIRAGTPICQIVFEPLDEPTEMPYGAEGCSSKYQDQERGPQAARYEVARAR